MLIPAGEFMMGNSHTIDEEMAAFKPYYEVKFTTGRQRGPVSAAPGADHAAVLPGHVPRHPRQFGQFVAATGYKTDAEKNKNGGHGYDGSNCVQTPDYNWRNTGFAQTDDHPAVNVSWNDATAFCGWLSRKEGKTYRLPTEAEWEYACRAGTTTRYWFGEDPEGLADAGNVADASYKAKFAADQAIRANDGYVFTSPVGNFRPNAWGLYDMCGNAWQLCSDWYGGTYYAASPADDPPGPAAGSERGCAAVPMLPPPHLCRSASRGGLVPDACDDNIGFRVVLALPQPARSAAKTFTNSIGMKFALIPAGEFWMGNGHSFEEEHKTFAPYENVFPASHLKDQYPRHRVRITRPFYLAANHVTRGQFRQFVDATGYKTDAEKDGKGGFGYDGRALSQATQYNWRTRGSPRPTTTQW